MKRKDLTIGLEVEVKLRWGSMKRAIVLDTAPWKDRTYRFDRKRTFVPAGDGTGVAVAVEDDFSYGDPPTWRPEVVRTAAIHPVGTQARLDAEYDAELKAQQDADQQRRNRRQAYADALGLKYYQVSMSTRGNDVTLPAKALDALLEKAGLSPDTTKETS